MKPILVGLLCLYSCTLIAEEYHVKQDGSGDYTTIQAAANIAMQGDTVTVHEGIYYEWVQPKNSGTAEQPITYRVNPGDTVWIDGENSRWSCFGPNPQTSAFNKIHYIVLDGFGLRNSRGKIWQVEQGRDGDINDSWTISAVTCAGGHHWTIQNCEIGPNAAGAIECGENDLREEKNLGNTLFTRTFGRHLIRNNYIHDNTAAIFGFVSHFTRLVGNRFENNKSTNFAGSHVKFLKSYGVQIEHNLFHNGTGQWQDIWFDNANQACRIRGNVFTGDGQCIYLEIDHGPTFIDHNIFNFTGSSPRNIKLGRGGGAAIMANNLVIGGHATGSNQGTKNRDLWEPGTARHLGKVDTDGGQGKCFNNLYLNVNLTDYPASADVIKGGGQQDFAFYNLVYDPAAGNVGNPGTHVFSSFSSQVSGEHVGDMYLLDLTVDGAIEQPNNVIVDNANVWPSGAMAVTNEMCPRMGTDINGQAWTNQTIKPGPFSDLQPGSNSYAFVFGPRRSQTDALDLRPSDSVMTPGLGVAVQKYDGVFNSFAEVLAASPSSEYTDTNWNLSQQAAFVMDGYFQAEEDGVYVFYLSDRRDFQFWIGDELLLTHPEPGKPREAKAAIALRAGMHRYRLLSRQTQRPDQSMNFQASYRHQSSSQQSIPNNLLHIGSTVPNAAPVITAVTPDPNPVVGMTSTLTAAATDNDNDPLTYTWSVTAKPVGAADPSFSDNGNLSAATTVTFAQAGAYSFGVTVTDGRGGSASNSVAVTVSQRASGLEIE